MKKLIPFLLMLTMMLSIAGVQVSAASLSYQYPDLPYGEVLFTENFDEVPDGEIFCNSPDQNPNVEAIEGGFVRLGVNWDNAWFILDGTEAFTDNVIISLSMRTPNPSRGLIYGLSLFKDTANAVDSGWDIMWAEKQGITPVRRPGNDQAQQFGDKTGKMPTANPQNITVMIANNKISVYHNGVFLTELDGTLTDTDGTGLGAMAYYTDIDLDKLVIYAIGEGEPTQPEGDSESEETSTVEDTTTVEDKTTVEDTTTAEDTTSTENTTTPFDDTNDNTVTTDSPVPTEQNGLPTGAIVGIVAVVVIVVAVVLIVLKKKK